MVSVNKVNLTDLFKFLMLNLIQFQQRFSVPVFENILKWKGIKTKVEQTFV